MTPPSVAIVGAGFGGVGTAIALRRAGIQDITVLERGERVGGVWNQNTYPGAACDVPSHLYSYSFARNPRWGRRFAQQAEIQRYVEDVARRNGVLDRVRLGTDVTSASWDDAGARWRLETDGGPVEADVLVCACGQLTRPAIPPLPGLDRFAGPAFHSSRWRHEVDLGGLRVGVLGSGASAIQFVPAIQPLVRSLTLVQRTPPWILPKPDRAYRPFDNRLFERVPAAQLAGRFGFWAFLEGGDRRVHRARPRNAPPGRDLAPAPPPAGPRPRAAPQAHPDLPDGMQASPVEQRLVPGADAAERRRGDRRGGGGGRNGHRAARRPRDRARRAHLRDRFPHQGVRRAHADRGAARDARSTSRGTDCPMRGTGSPSRGSPTCS